MKILIWHVHGGWMDSFVQGPHDYLLPTTTQRDGWGLGRGGRAWPIRAQEVAPEALREREAAPRTRLPISDTAIVNA